VGVGDVSKRILLGRKLRSQQLGETRLPKRLAFPVFASDALSSMAYAPDEIFIMLALAGVALYSLSLPVALAVSAVLLIVVASYRQNVHAYPSGGGDYEIATTNLGPKAGVTVASALVVDYVLVVAVSLSSAAQYAGSAWSAVAEHRTWVAVGLVVFLALMNLRGVRESGRSFAIPAYAFMLAIGAMCVVGVVRALNGTLPDAQSAQYDILPAEGYEGTLTAIAVVFLVARAFSSGCAALTGVEAISNGVPAFRRPKSRNAATTLLLLGLTSVTFMVAVVALGNTMEVTYVDPHDLGRLVGPDGQPVGPDFHQDTLIAQIAQGVFSGFSFGFYFVIVASGVILVLAANTAFNSFPVLGSILARDGFLPRQLAARGDRLAYSNGIIILTGMAVALVVAFDAQVTRLIQLYIVGVFVSFTLSQLGMVKHWTRHLAHERDPVVRGRMQRSRMINGLGLVSTGLVLVVVVVTKFLAGAWITVLAMVLFVAIMVAIRRHYARVEAELAADETDKVLPTRVHAIVLVSKLHKPTLRALAFAKATRPNVLEAVSIGVDSEATDRLVDDWDRRGVDVPLKILHSPYREMIRPIVEYAAEVRNANPRGVVVVFIPEYVVGHWWEQLLHNQSALRLKGRLLFTPGVMVTSVPYQLRSSEAAIEREERAEQRPQAGDLRRAAMEARMYTRSPDEPDELD
jgi:amino acid transporter